MRTRISNDAIIVLAPHHVIALEDLESITHTMPALAKHDQLSFKTSDENSKFDVAHLNYDGRDIIHLIGIRLETGGKYLTQQRRAVRGALTGTWNVQTGNPFDDV